MRPSARRRGQQRRSGAYVGDSYSGSQVRMNRRLSRQNSDGGAITNLAESYFSRLSRMVDGQHHRVSARYLHQCAHETAWKEDPPAPAERRAGRSSASARDGLAGQPPVGGVLAVGRASWLARNCDSFASERLSGVTK